VCNVRMLMTTIFRLRRKLYSQNRERAREEALGSPVKNRSCYLGCWSSKEMSDSE